MFVRGATIHFGETLAGAVCRASKTPSSLSPRSGDRRHSRASRQVFPMLHVDEKSLRADAQPLVRLRRPEWPREWRAVLDAIPQMVWSVAADGCDAYFNRRWLEFAGVAVGEPHGTARLALVHPDDRERAGAVWQHSLASGQPYEAEYRLRHNSGEYRWILSRGRAERDESGQIIGWYGTCTDIHEQVLAKQALDASERRLRHILDSLPQIVWSIAADSGSPDYYNARWYEFTGLPQGSVGGPEWTALYHPADREAALSVWRQSRATGEPYECEYRLRHRSGEYRWVVSRARAERDASGRIVRWHGTCSDVHDRALARQALKESENRTQTILDSVPQIIWSAGPDGQLNYVNNQWKGTGSAEELALGESWINAIHPEDRQRAYNAWAHSVSTGQLYEVELRVLGSGGSYRHTLIRAQPARNATGDIIQWYGTCTDIHERIIAQEALKASESLNRGMIEASPDCVALLNCGGEVLFVNKAALRAAGTTDSSSLIGTSWSHGFETSIRRRAQSAVRAAQAGMLGHFEVAAGAADRRWWDVVVAPVCNAVGEPVNLVAISRDVTHQKSAEEKARWAADHDALTLLPNRLLLQQRMDESIIEAAASGGGFALLLLDVDHFKQINDMLGHDAGDSLLCTFADRLKQACRPDDMIARLGGDEFAILLPCVQDEQQVQAVVCAILAKLSEPCIYGGRVLDCHASIGASIYPHQARSRAELLKNADVALYAAKAAGRCNLKLFRPEMRMDLQRRASMLNLARDALRQDSIFPFYQPKIDMRTGCIAGFEALLRWRDSGGRVHLPDTVAAAFEDLNLAAEISERMVSRIVEDLQRWRDAGVAFHHVAFNAAAAEFRRGDFAERLLERMSAASLPASSLQVEVTETVFLGRGADYVERALKLLSSAGVKIALDDFGTGYASLSHLKQFPVDIIKIDRSFVRNLEGDPDDAAIIDAVIQLGRSLGIGVVAEGIETEAQHDLLCAKGCDFGQGFLYGKAISFEEVAPLLHSCCPNEGIGGPKMFIESLGGRRREIMNDAKSRTGASIWASCDRT